MVITSARINRETFASSSRDLYLYDIPARYKEDEVVKGIRSLGKINKLTIKWQYKYQTIKVNINLEKELEELYQQKTRSVKVTFGLADKQEVIDVQWFVGKLTVKEIHDLCKWKAIKYYTKISLMTFINSNMLMHLGKKVCFGKVWVFLAKFESAEKWQNIIDKSVELEGLDKAWKVYGKDSATQLNKLNKDRSGTSRQMVLSKPCLPINKRFWKDQISHPWPIKQPFWRI